MKNKMLRIFCGVLSVVSLLSVITIMFEFFGNVTSDFYGYSYSYTLYGFGIYTDETTWEYILLGVMGIVALLWDLAFGAFAVIDARYNDKLWRIIRYGYAFGVVAALLNFGLMIANLAFRSYFYPSAVIFTVLLGLIAAAKIFALFLKNDSAPISTEH